MKLLRVYTPETKRVTYRGNVFDVPLWVNYMAVDEDGEMVGHRRKPTSRTCSWLSLWNVKHIADVDLEGYDWKLTLEEV